MRLLIASVGQKPPAWAEAAYDEFERRFPPEMRLELKAVKAEPRTSGKAPAQLMQAEGKRLEAVLPPGTRRVILDERGTRWTTRALADGLDPELKATADETARLSDLTLPHAFVRVLLAEALYRAWSLSTGHPYHRE